MLPSKVSLNKGKKAVLMNLISNGIGENMIACVDADYDYLLQNTTDISQKINTSPYVFHTYAYAIENLQCFAPSLHDVCVAVTLNDKTIFDFEKYLYVYSKAIYPLFIWNIWFYRNNLYNSFSMTDFLNIINISHFSVAKAFSNIQRIKIRVRNKIKQLKKEYPNAKDSILYLKNELNKLGVNDSNTYLYIQGHHLFDKVVVPAMEKVCDILKQDRETEIYQKAIHIIQKKNELSSYRHSTKDVESMLRRYVGYYKSEQYLLLKNDLETFIRSNKFK